VSTEQILKVECNISATTNFMLSGILSVSDPSFYGLHILTLTPVSRHENREKFTYSRPDSNLQSKVKALPTSIIPDSPYGPLFMER